MEHRKASHDSARERLVSVHPGDALFDRRRASPDAVTRAYHDYRLMLEAYFRGQALSSEVLRARIRWCAEESRLVEARRAGQKALEYTSARRWRQSLSR